ncbi:unnamed protein product [Sphagnum troendelagicum]
MQKTRHHCKPTQNRRLRFALQFGLMIADGGQVGGAPNPSPNAAAPPSPPLLSLVLQQQQRASSALPTL